MLINSVNIICGTTAFGGLYSEVFFGKWGMNPRWDKDCEYPIRSAWSFYG